MKCPFYLIVEDKERCERCLEYEQCEIIRLPEENQDEPEIEY